MIDRIYLAWRYVAFHRGKTAVLVLSIAIIAFVPAGLRVLVAQSAEALTQRAASTPLLIGAQGSPLELVLRSLYFRGEVPTAVSHAQAERVTVSGQALAIPLLARFHAQGAPIVGTTPEYLELRELELAAGRSFAALGECVLGAGVARERGLVPGDAIVSSPEDVFDLAGTYPLRMQISGVLAPAHTPDDGAVFCDLKTAWVIAGLGHGHADLSRPEASGDVLRREGDLVVANAAVVQYTEIDAANADSFHFHGERADFPLTSVIAVPTDERASAILQGRYQAPDERFQIVQPADVMDELLETVVTVEGYVAAAAATVGVSTVLVTALVFLLSIRMRRREIETMAKIGSSRGTIGTVLALEVVFVVLLSLSLAGALTWATATWAADVVENLVLA